MLVEWVLIERRGAILKRFLENNFSGLEPIEHFQSFYRYKIGSNVSIGKVFGLFEEKKTELKITQYSIRQSTLEQIFNAFAVGSMQVRKNNRDHMVINVQPANSEAVPLRG